MFNVLTIPACLTARGTTPELNEDNIILLIENNYECSYDTWSNEEYIDGKPLTENALAQIRGDIETTFARYHVTVSQKLISTAVSSACHKHEYDPLVYRLDAAERLWHDSGEPKNLLQMFHDYFGCEDTKFTENVTKILTYGLIGRAYAPGMKYDKFIVFSRANGQGLTPFFKNLSAGFFDDSLDVSMLDMPIAIERLCIGVWLAEIEVMKHFTKSDVEMLKAFLANQVDTYRPKYSKMVKSVPRRFVPIGTATNVNAGLSRVNDDDSIIVLYCKPERRTKSALDMTDSLMQGEKSPRSTIMDAEPVFAESCGCNSDNRDNALEFRKETALKIERTYTGIHILNRLIAALAVAKNIDECSDAICKWLEAIDCGEFTLCLVSDWEKTYNTLSYDDGGNYPEAMTVPLIWDHGERCAVKSFPSKQLHPEQQLTSGKISYYIPLHFGPRILGYYIMSNTDFPIYSNHFHTITMSIGNAIETISKLNVLDPLCGIYNRNGFNINAGYIFEECIQAQAALSVIFIDVDGLKIINDTYGHSEGDFTIKAVSETIELSCGSMDVCGRLGGDEFVIIGRGENFADIFKKRFDAELERKNKEMNKPYELSASVGFINAIPDKSDTLIEFIQQADAEMYLVKKARRKQRI